MIEMNLTAKHLKELIECLRNEDKGDPVNEEMRNFFAQVTVGSQATIRMTIGEDSPKNVDRITRCLCGRSVYWHEGESTASCQNCGKRYERL